MTKQDKLETTLKIIDVLITLNKNAKDEGAKGVLGASEKCREIVASVFKEDK